VKLRVDDITAESRDLRFAEPEAEINQALATGTIREYQLTRPVTIELAYYRAGTELFLEGTIGAATSARCARCAEDFAGSARRGFRYVLTPRSMGAGADQDLRPEDLEFTLYDGEEVDLTPLIREQVLLALAERPLCDCRVEIGDPRLAVLRSLKVGRA
jgi:uncharacterized metal-binding protein YceD (DUF177 family)